MSLAMSFGHVLVIAIHPDSSRAFLLQVHNIHGARDRHVSNPPAAALPHRLSWAIMGLHRLSWFFVGLHWLSWVVVGLHWHTCR